MRVRHTTAAAAATKEKAMSYYCWCARHTNKTLSALWPHARVHASYLF